MKQFAVIGSPVEHSLSPLIHQSFAQSTGIALTYVKLEGKLDAFESQVSTFFSGGGKGLNVTLPFKGRAFLMAQARTSRASRAQAANTLWMQDGVLWADNTDGAGLLRDLARYATVQDADILLLGAGGAASGVIGPLLDAKPKRLLLSNRSLEKAKALEERFPGIVCCPLTAIQGEFDLMLNATSSSLEQQSLPIPESVFQTRPFCYDLSYALSQDTSFVAQAKQKGCEATDGLGMLVEQAAESFFIWHGIRPATDGLLKNLLLKKRSDLFG